MYQNERLFQTSLLSDALTENYLQPVTVETMAFRLLRSKGILKDLHNRCQKIRSKNFNIV